MKSKTILFIDESEKDYMEAIKYSFSKCELSSINNEITPPELENLAKEINSSYNEVIFFGYFYNYYMLLPILSKKLKIKWILPTSVASLFNVDIYNAFFQVIEYKERKLVNDIATLDYNMYLLFKDKYNFSFLKLDINKKDKYKKNNIGIVGYDYLEEVSFFNELSAISLSKYDTVNIQNEMNVTKRFCEDFGLKINKIDDAYTLIASSKLNLYVNFFNTNDIKFLYSMDNDSPCIIGNSDLLDNNKYLKDQLVLKSDDSIDEMLEKVEDVEKNKAQILKEYKSWRQNYSKESKDLINIFLEK